VKSIITQKGFFLDRFSLLNIECLDQNPKKDKTTSASYQRSRVVLGTIEEALLGRG